MTACIRMCLTFIVQWGDAAQEMDTQEYGMSEIVATKNGIVIKDRSSHMLLVFLAECHIGRSENMGTSGMADLHMLANHLCMQVTSPY